MAKPPRLPTAVIALSRCLTHIRRQFVINDPIKRQRILPVIEITSATVIRTKMCIDFATLPRLCRNCALSERTRIVVANLRVYLTRVSILVTLIYFIINRFYLFLSILRQRINVTFICNTFVYHCSFYISYT